MEADRVPLGARAVGLMPGLFPATKYLLFVVPDELFRIANSFRE